jgi:hypothetical protein
MGPDPTGVLRVPEPVSPLPSPTLSRTYGVKFPKKMGPNMNKNPKQDPMPTNKKYSRQSTTLN